MSINFQMWAQEEIELLHSTCTCKFIIIEVNYINQINMNYVSLLRSKFPTKHSLCLILLCVAVCVVLSITVIWKFDLLLSQALQYSVYSICSFVKLCMYRELVGTISVCFPTLQGQNISAIYDVESQIKTKLSLMKYIKWSLCRFLIFYNYKKIVPF